MAPSASLETFLLHCGTFIGERLEAAPFQTFLVLASVWILSIPAFVLLITRYSSLFNSKNAKPQLRCRSCGSTDVGETLAGPSIPTKKKN
ncbi:uncharacterized protein N7487_007810 [Penicillium crustosum]|uniref:uncharacterized protein n=1 Tax=Penicillium crustosum TaxID=36656 RepID=UPI00239471AB|nr:uncharacterized protein N7487_007810 [Penicillium crustosum]KAJ5401914.1 hypothetical protein N7487_007810 [Penicillium crustosum]